MSRGAGAGEADEQAGGHARHARPRRRHARAYAWPEPGGGTALIVASDQVLFGLYVSSAVAEAVSLALIVWDLRDRRDKRRKYVHQVTAYMASGYNIEAPPGAAVSDRDWLERLQHQVNELAKALSQSVMAVRGESTAALQRQVERLEELLGLREVLSRATIGVVLLAVGLPTSSRSAGSAATAHLGVGRRPTRSRSSGAGCRTLDNCFGQPGDYKIA